MNESCECVADGYCQRYNRNMGGRMRELCAGINVDLGTAAVFREQWGREAGTQLWSKPPTKLLLKTDQAPGDALAMTAAIYSLHKAHPTRYMTAVESLWPEVFEHNPDVVPASSGMADLQMHYPAIHKSNERGIHFMQGWCEFLGMALGVHVPLLTNRPRLYFEEPPPVVENFWVVCSGGKSDFTAKLWGHDNYQMVVYMLKGYTKFVQVGAAGGDNNHRPLEDVVDMLGKTSLRGLFDLVRRARGVLCGVSLLMHAAAALEKPAVVVAGGREPVQWNSYPRQQYVHTVGALGCSDTQGKIGGACWRSRTVPLGDNQYLDKDTCERPVNGKTPKCMTIISPQEVAKLIMRYNK